MRQCAVLSTDDLHAATATLLPAAGLAGECALQQLPGGGNNRVFRVDVDGTRALLKAYFQHPEDRRNRLRAEYSFCGFAWQNGLRSVPRPLAQDPEHQLGLYEFIDGRKLLAEEIDAAAVGQAMTFFADVNRHRHLPAARELQPASEAYFKLVDHLECIERRLTVLRDMQPASPIDHEAAAFVREELGPGWERVRAWVEAQSARLGLNLENEIAREDRRLSPSDFGFHNAILTAEGKLRFLDFEYAGWDDPAKMVCDFFCQVAMLMPAVHFETVVEAAAAGLQEPQRLRNRVALLMPVYRVKWCCIVLNEFVRVSSRRRVFANADNHRDEKKLQQLHKARRVLHSVTRERGIYGLR
jgi:hypothetical protein